MTTPIWTTHARERWQERFGHLDFASEYASAVPFGGQFGKTKRLLVSENGAVFVLTDRDVLTTVLTREYAMANMQAHIPASFARVQPTTKTKTPPPPKKQKPAQLTDAQMQRLNEAGMESGGTFSSYKHVTHRRHLGELIKAMNIPVQREPEARAIYRNAFYRGVRMRNGVKA